MSGYYPTYSWEVKNSEIEFLIKTKTGDIIPVEVKSGKRTQAKSLKSYIDRYQPKMAVKLVGTAGGNNAKDADLVLPLYYASTLQSL